MNALRLTEGIESELFETRTGLLLENINDRLQQAMEKDLLSFNDDRIKPTTLGKKFLNDLIAQFMD